MVFGLCDSVLLEEVWVIWTGKWTREVYFGAQDSGIFCVYVCDCAFACVMRIVCVSLPAMCLCVCVVSNKSFL